MKYIRKTYLPDVLGVAASGLCLVHCIAFPLLALYFFKDTPAEGSAIETMVSAILLMGSFMAVYLSSRHNSTNGLAYFLWLFFCLFAFSILFEEDFAWTQTLSYFASAGLILCHIINIWQCHKCNQQ